jgi:hypothetical protein
LARKKYPKDGDRLAAMLYYTNTRRTQWLSSFIKYLSNEDSDFSKFNIYIEKAPTFKRIRFKHKYVKPILHRHFRFAANYNVS